MPVMGGGLGGGQATTPANRPYIRAFANAVQPTTNGFSVVAFGSVSDGASAFAGNTFTVPADGAGIWAIDVGVVLIGLLSGDTVNCSLFVGNAETAKVGEQAIGAAGSLALTSSFHLRLAPGNQVTVRASTSTAGRNIYGDAANQVTTFTAYLL